MERVFKTLSDEKYHYVYGVVYSPLQIDTDWETMTAEDVRKMAHDFLASGKVESIDVMHDHNPCGAVVVESFVARKGDPDFPEGAWVLGVRMSQDSPMWEAIRVGKLNGFSVDAFVRKVPKQVVVDIARIALGDTEFSAEGDLPAHCHEYYVEFDSNGRVTTGVTNKVHGHTHVIVGTTVTEASLDHSHRYFVE